LSVIDAVVEAVRKAGCIIAGWE